MAMFSSDEKFMARALELAEKGKGSVEPNPMVGAVIVRGGEIVAEGYHKKFGGPHAEIEALIAAGEAGEDVKGATMYVTLEPCSHFGKTPPCADALIKAGIARVVVAMEDPDEQVSGRGLEMLRQAGVQVDGGICEAVARELLAAYIKLRTCAQPWVICKWAQTADGAIALPSEQGRWISSKESLTRVHEIRSWCDGILVGVDTVLADDPLLTNRSPAASRQPVRIIVDSKLRTPVECQLVNTAGVSPVIIATTADGVSAAKDRLGTLQKLQVEILELPAGPAGLVDISALLDELGRRQFTYLLVEGGAKILSSMIENELADELQVFISPQVVGETSQPSFDISDVIRAGKYSEVGSEKIGVDTLRIFRLDSPLIL